jgi:CHAT domain-containing protein/tetratricopeptide (TPR) repeat protein
MMKRVIDQGLVTLLIGLAFTVCSQVQALLEDQVGEAAQQAEAASVALESGDIETALQHFLAAHEVDPSNETYVSSAATLAEEVGFVELALEMQRTAVDLAVSSGQAELIDGLNSEINRLLSIMPDWVHEKMAAASQVSAGQQEELQAWQEMTQLAQEAVAAGDGAAALEAMENALMIANQAFGEEHWITVSSYRDLGYLYRQLGQAEEAEQFYSLALGFAQQALTDGHPQTIEIQGLLAELYSAMNAYDEAAMIFDLMAAAYQESLGPGNAFTLAGRLSLANVLDTQGNHLAAGEVLDGLCDGFQGTYGRYHEQSIDCLRLEASVLSYQGKLAEAVQAYEQVIALMSDSFVSVDTRVLDVLMQLAEVYREQGRYAEATQLLAGVISTASQLNEMESVNSAKAYIARVFNNEGDYERAERITNEVLSYGQLHWQNTPIKRYNTMLELGGIYQNQGKLAEAERAFLEAYEGLNESMGTDHQSTIVALSNLGQVYEQQGLYDLAEPALKSALTQFERVLGTDHANSSRSRNNLALLHESQGNFREAEPLHVKSLDIMSRLQGDDHNDTIAVRNNLAFLYMLMQQYDRAAPLFEKVYQQWSMLFGEDHQNTLKAMNNLGRIYHKQGNLAEAETLFLRAGELRASELGPEHMDTLRSMIDLGALYVDQKRLAEANTILQEAVVLLEKVLGEQHPYTFEALDHLAVVKERIGQVKEAVALRETAFDRRSEFLDRMLWVTGENAREGYIRLHRPETDKYLSLIARLDSKEGGKKEINASLQRKGLLLKITSEIQQIAQLSRDPKLVDLAADLEKARKDLASLTLSGPTPETQGRHADVLYELEQRVNELQGLLGRASARYRSSIAHIDAEALEAALEDDSVLIDFLTYSDGDERKLMASVLNKRGSDVDYDLIVYDDLADIEDVIVEYRTYIQDETADEDEILETGQLAYEKIWMPLEEAVGDTDHVYLIPDGILNILPFNALVNKDEEYLIQNVDVHILSSGRDLLPNGFKLAEGDYVILAGPDYDSDEIVSTTELEEARGRRSRAIQLGIRGGASGLRGLSFDPLPGAEQEGRLITDQVKANEQNSKVYFKSEAQERVVAELDHPPEILHMATHGFFLKADDTLRKRLLKLQRGADLQVPPPGDNPLLRAGLAFAGINTNAQFFGDIDTVNDGVLTALEVLGLNLTGTKLVVLSACETGLGEIHEGEGVYGLRRSFQEAGVAEVISSLWEVSDAGTQALMTSFYSRLVEGMPAREALRTTQLELLDSPEWGYPYIWSAFMIVGSYESAGYSLR